MYSPFFSYNDHFSFFIFYKFRKIISLLKRILTLSPPTLIRVCCSCDTVLRVKTHIGHSWLMQKH